jgi:hypothetical protein
VFRNIFRVTGEYSGSQNRYLQFQVLTVYGVGMKIAVCIQAQDTGRILFVKESPSDTNITWDWTWPETRFHLNWACVGVEKLRRQIGTYLTIDDLCMEWLHAKNELHIIHFRVPEERKVYLLPGEWQWRSLFEFPETIHPFVDAAVSDLIFLENLVTRG